MIGLFRPSDAAIRTFLDRQKDEPFSYSGAGSVVGGPAPDGFVVDHRRHRLGERPGAFDAAKRALRSWEMFRTGWTEVYPREAPLICGQIVAILAHVYGSWTLNPARILRVIDEDDRFGFVYGSLREHAESGEERFLVERLSDDSVWFDLLGVSRPGRWFSRVAGPLTRRVQHRFARDSGAAMARAVARGTDDSA